MSQLNSLNSSKYQQKSQPRTVTKQKYKNLDQFNNLHRGSFGAIFQTTQRKVPQYKQEYTDESWKKSHLLNQGPVLQSLQLKYQSSQRKTNKYNFEQSSNSKEIKYKELETTLNQKKQRLNKTEQKLKHSQIKYSQLGKMYENACQSIKNLEIQLTRNQDQRLKQLIQLKNNFSLLQTQNQTNRRIISEKDQSINSLSAKLKKLSIQQQISKQQQKKYQSKTKHQQFSYLEQIMNRNYRLSQQKQYNKQQTLQNQQRQMSENREIKSLKQQIKHLQRIVSENEIQKQKLLNQIQLVYTKKHDQSIQSQLQRKSLQQQYSQWLNQARQQKIKLIQLYQTKLSDDHSANKSSKRQFYNQLQSQLLKSKQIIFEKNKQIQNLESNLDIIKSKESLYTNQKTNLLDKIAQLQNLINFELKKSVQELKKTNQKLLKINKQLDAKANQQNLRYLQIYEELKSLKNQFTVIWQDKVDALKLMQEKQIKIVLLSDKIVLLSDQIVVLSDQISKFKQKNKKNESMDLNLNATIKQSNKHLQNRLLIVQEQNQNLTRELLAERLQSTNLRTQLNQQTTLLKRQYQLSLQNTKTQLSSRIKQVKEEKTHQVIEKQKIYLQLRDLQRKYQLLVSQMLTVDDMMAIATKVHKRNSKFVKYNK